MAARRLGSRNKPLVVVGGGDSAVEEATYLTRNTPARSISCIAATSYGHPRSWPERVVQNPKIEPVWNHALDEVLGNDKHGVSGVRLRSMLDDSKHEREATGVFLAIGHTPNTTFLDGQLKLTAKNYIKWTVPFRTNTSVDGVFAAGDVADDYYRQAVTAAGSGCMAALDAERWLGARFALLRVAEFR